LAKIVVKNGEWDDARNKLKSSLDAQQAAFNANLKAAFPPPAAAARPSAPTAAPQAASKPTPGTKSTFSGLPRSRLSSG